MARQAESAEAGGTERDERGPRGPGRICAMERCCCAGGCRARLCGAGRRLMRAVAVVCVR